MTNYKNIEWLGETGKPWNPITGCNGPSQLGIPCFGCFAYQRSLRLRGRFGYPKDNPFKPTFHLDKLNEPLGRKKPRIYFLCSMGEWLDFEVKSSWRKACLKVMAQADQHIFITLTKQYNELWQISEDSPKGFVPPNIWVGISVTTKDQLWGIDKLRHFKMMDRIPLAQEDIDPSYRHPSGLLDPIVFISFEPLLEDLGEVDLSDIDWIIIGARSRQGKAPYFRPEKEWVIKLVDKAHSLKIPVFLKPNLKDYVSNGWFPSKVEEMPIKIVSDNFKPPICPKCGTPFIFQLYGRGKEISAYVRQACNCKLDLIGWR